MPRAVFVILLAALLAAAIVLMAGLPGGQDRGSSGPLAAADSSPGVAATAGPSPGTDAAPGNDDTGIALPPRSPADSCAAARTRGPEDADLERLLTTLAASDNAEHLLAAALLSLLRSGEPDFTMMRRALDADPRHPLLAWNLVQHCAIELDSALCLVPGYYQRALAIDGTNGALWAQIAMNRLDSNNAQSALAAMRSANTAPEFRFYDIEHVLLFERSFAAAADMSYADRVEQAIAAAAWIVPGEARVFAACQDRAPHSAEWQVQCLRFGQRLEQEGNTFGASLYGLELQVLTLELANDSGNLAAANLRYDALIREFGHEPMQVTAAVLAGDSRIAGKFVNEWQAHGELAAHRLARAELARLDRQAGFGECD